MIKFAKTRWQYDSYTDFWKLVELSDYPVCFVDEIDFTSQDTYITAPMNGEWRPLIDSHRGDITAKLVLWNLERPGGSTLDEYRDGNQQLINDGYLSSIIVSDRELAKQTGFNFVPIGIHPDLGQPGSLEDKKYDVIHLMCPSFRRGKWFDSNWMTLGNVMGMTVAANGWGNERHERLQASKYMANMHQDSYLYIEPLRFTLAAAYGLRIMTEPSFDFYPYDECGGIIVPGGDWMHYVKHYSEVDYLMGISFRESMLNGYQFRQCVERFLS